MKDCASVFYKLDSAMNGNSNLREQYFQKQCICYIAIREMQKSLDFCYSKCWSWFCLDIQFKWTRKSWSPFTGGDHSDVHEDQCRYNHSLCDSTSHVKTPKRWWCGKLFSENFPLLCLLTDWQTAYILIFYFARISAFKKIKQMATSTVFMKCSLQRLQFPVCGIT